MITMRLINKISCAFGNHKYILRDIQVTCISEDLCRVESVCANCGRHDCWLVEYRMQRVDVQEGGEVNDDG